MTNIVHASSTTRFKPSRDLAGVTPPVQTRRVALVIHLLAVLSGFLLALAFAPFDMADAAWVALIPLMIASAFARPAQVWRLGWIAGVVFWLITIFWLTRVTWFGWFLLCLYSGLYVIPVTLFSAVWLRRFSTNRFLPNAGYMVLISLVWVAAEWGRSTFFTGFPWNPLGASQWENLAFLQHATWGGVYGLSALIVFTNAAIALTILRYLQGHAKVGRKPHPELMMGMAAVVVAFVLGNRAAHEHEILGREYRIALIQPSIPQDDKWDEEKASMIYARLRELTSMAVQVTQPDLVVWPETALPFDVRYSEPCYQTVLDLARMGTPILVGSMDAEYPDGELPVFYNSSFLFDVNGKIVQEYRKRHLVLLGEYVPLHQHIRFITAMTPLAESFSPGSTSTVFRAPGLFLPFSSLICFEDTLAYLGRDAVRNGARLLVNQTNDAWFDPLWGSRQHMALSVFRAVENRVPVVRAANTGISCAIDARGKVQEKLTGADGRHDGPGFQLVNVLLPYDRMPLTFYTRHGDVFAWSCFAPGFIAWLLAWRANRKARLASGIRPE